MTRSPLLPAIFFCCSAAQGAQFQLATLIRWGSSSGGGSNWEIAAGSSAGLWSATGNLTPHFSDSGGGNRAFQISYQKASNTATLSVFQGNTVAGASTSLSFNPTGGTAVGSDAIWTLPASSFFVQAAADASLSSITLSNLSLTVGSLNILTPLQTTPMSRTQFIGLNAGTVNHNGDVTFVGDASGNWQLQGLLGMTSIGLGMPNSLTFGLSAIANSAPLTPNPEPGTYLLIGLGFLFVAAKGRNQLGRHHS